MTFREKLTVEHPELVGDDYTGGCDGCPRDYGYEDKETGACQEITTPAHCYQCWNREIPDAAPSEAEMTDDPVNHPAHYTAGGIECIDAIAAALTCQTDPMDAWLTGQVLKYMWRWPMKNGVEDLKKARFYLDRLIGRKEQET